MDMRVFDIFKIGIGPSSSHTVGPMLAARRFLQECGDLENARHIQADLYGSLALTGIGHATNQAVLLGLLGETPQELDPQTVPGKLAAIADSGCIRLSGKFELPFSLADDLRWHKTESLPGHPNGMRFTLTYKDGSRCERIYYSVGGGFIRGEHDAADIGADTPVILPFPFANMTELLHHGQRTGLSLAAMLRANELTQGDEASLDSGLDKIAAVMRQCIDNGLQAGGELPGGLGVKRRAALLWDTAHDATAKLPHDAMHRVSLYAMAVSEENAAGGRIVTAPTNGAAGIIPAVLRYFAEDCRPTNPVQGCRDFLLVAGAIAMLCKRNASISGAEIGCQGEVGVASAMAAAGLTAALGGDNAQIETAAEIGIEHHLGMTCDPIGGLVQIPCIERNGMGAVKAITAASLALGGDGTHHVSLDQAIETMRQTGADMQAKYRETSLGGLAVHVVSIHPNAC